MKVFELLQTVLGVDPSTAKLAVAAFGIGALLMLNEKSKHDLRHKHGISPEQRKAQNPPIGKKWRRRIPEGIVLGKVGKDYICMPEKATASGFDVGHCLVLGGSGSGKTSSVFADSLLACWGATLVKGDDGSDQIDISRLPFSYICTDIKGELSSNFMPRTYPPESEQGKNNPYYLIDSENREMSYGYDPFCRLKAAEESGQFVGHDLISQVASEIASCYVTTSANDKNAYFTDNALTMLTGLIAYCMESNPRIELVDMMQRIISENVRDLMEEAYNQSLPGSVTRHHLGRYQGVSKDNSSIEDCIATMTQKLGCWSRNDTAWICRDAPIRIGVQDIRERPLVMSCPMDKLSDAVLAPIFRMVLVTANSHLLSHQPEPGTARPVVAFYDECWELGGSERGAGVPGILTVSSIGRSMGLALILCYQSSKQIEIHHSREGARVLEDNCSKVLISISDPETSRAAQTWTGKFEDRVISVNGGSKMSTTISWRERPIFDESYFAQLTAQNHGKGSVVVCPNTDSFFQTTKAAWWRDPYFVRLQKRITQLDKNKEEQT